jgi:hypothetical protein
MIPLVLEDKLTGKVRFRQGWRGRLVLQVETHDSMWLGFLHQCRAFRDARVDDFLPGTLNEIGKLSAQGTEAQRAETATEIGGSVHDGPVPEGNAP